jgi:hypothetical protein
VKTPAWCKLQLEVFVSSSKRSTHTPNHFTPFAIGAVGVQHHVMYHATLLNSSNCTNQLLLSAHREHLDGKRCCLAALLD